MRRIIVKFAKFLLNSFDKNSENDYNVSDTVINQENQDNIENASEDVRKIVTDWLKYENEFSINDFYEMYWYSALKGMYNIINEYYISELSKHIYEWNEVELAKLKHIQIILNDFLKILKEDENY